MHFSSLGFWGDLRVYGELRTAFHVHSACYAALRQLKVIIPAGQDCMLQCS